MGNSVVLITGASRGLGRAMAVAFASKGYKVGINFLENEAEAQKTAELIKKSGSESLLLRANVSDSKSVNKMVEKIISQWGRIDVLINNAGLTRNQLLVKMTDQEWRDVMAVNLDGVFYTTRAVLPHMQTQKEGVILNVASYIAHKGVRGASNYAVAKAGVITLTKNTAIEEGRFNIRANAIMPGFHVTEMNEDVWKRFEPEIRSQHLLKNMPVKEEMADFVVKIAELTTVTGQVFAYESRPI